MDNKTLTTPLGNNISDYDDLSKRVEFQKDLLRHFGKNNKLMFGFDTANWNDTPYKEILPIAQTSVPVEVYDLDTGKTLQRYNNVVDYQRDTLITSGGSVSPQKLGWESIAPMAVSQVGGYGLIGLNLGGALGALVGAGLGTASVLKNIGQFDEKAYEAYANDKDRSVDLLGVEAVDKDGKPIVKLDAGKAAKGNQVSGGWVKKLQQGADTPATWDSTGTRLNINVSPSFATSDAYKDYVDYISTNLEGLTRDNDTNGETLTQINNYLKNAQRQFFYDQEELQAFKNMYPNASLESLDKGIANQLAGYFSDQDDLEGYKMSVYDSKNQLIEKDATAVFDELYDMGNDKIKKDEYLGKLSAALADPTISDDSKAIIQGQLNAIYLVNSRDGSKYRGMIEKSFWDHLGETSLVLISPNDVAEILSGGQAYGELKYFTNNAIAQGITSTAGTIINMASTMKVMDWVENGFKFVGKKGLSALGKMGNQVFGSGNKLTGATDWLIQKTNQAGSIAAFQEIGANGITSRSLLEKTFTMGLDLGYQALADLSVDAIKVKIQSVAGKETDFWEEFRQDFTMDLLFTYGHTGMLQAALANAGLKNFSVADIQRVIRDNSRIELDQDTGVKTLRIDFEGRRPDVALKIDAEKGEDGKILNPTELTEKEFGQAMLSAHYAINNRSSQLAAKVVVALNKNKAISTFYKTAFDSKIGMKMLGYQRLAESGDYTDLVKLSNMADSRRVYSETFQDFIRTTDGRAAYDGLGRATDDFRNATGSKKFTADDNAYMNAKQELSRVEYDYGKNSTEYQNASAFYKKDIESVDTTRGLALDQFTQSLVAFAKALANFEKAEGLETTSFFNMIQKYPGYFPVFAKPDTNGVSRPVEYRRTNRTTTDRSVRQSPREMDDPLSSSMRMMRNVIANAARARQLKTVVDVAAKLQGIDVIRDGEFMEDYQKLPTEELIAKYNIPKSVRAEFHKLADSETAYKKFTDEAMTKSLLAKHIEEYQAARKQIENNATKADTTKYRTVEGDPMLSRTKGGYKKGMTREEIDEHFLDMLQISLESLASSAKRHNGKVREYFTVEYGRSIERIMQETRESLDSFEPTQFIAKMTDELMDMAPMVSYDQLIAGYVPRTIARREEILADEDIASGRAGYDIAKNKKVLRGGAPIRIYTQGHVETYYLKGNTKADQQKADAVAEVLNAQLAQPIKNAFLRGLSNLAIRTARIKRSLVNGLLPSRAVPNKLRDTGQAAVAVGGSALMSPRAVFEDLIDTDLYTPEQKAEILDVLDRIAEQTSTYIENEVVNELQRGTIANAERRAKKPQRPLPSQQFGLRPLQRTANQIKYQFKSLLYNAKNLFHGGLSEILMTPGNLLESNTRRTVGQNSFMVELTARRQLGQDFQTALAESYSRGTWAARTATTDFSTKGSLTEILAKGTPFSYSNFSDISSKLETFVMDPIGVSARTSLYILAYTTNLATMLASEDNRRRYMNMSEYERTHNLMLPDGAGGVVKVAIDEGMSGLLAPFRVFTEALAFQEPVTFWKIFGAMLDIGPLELSGFTEGDRFNFQRGIESFTDTYAPAVVTGALEMLTGRNFYYGNDLSVDDDDLAIYGETAESAGDYTTKSNNSKTLRMLADLTHWPQWRIQQAVSVFGGTVGEYVVYTLDKLQGATDDETYGKNAAQAFYKPFISTTNNIESAFYDVLDGLEEERAKLLPKLLAKTRAITIATGTEQAKLKVEHQKLLDDFATKAADAVQKYLSVYQMTGGLSTKQAQRVYYLFDFEDDYMGASFVAGSAGASAANKLGTQYHYQAQKMAANVLNDAYTSRGLYRKDDGTYERETPYGMRGLQAIVNNRTNEYLAGIENIVKRNNLSDEYQKVYDAREAIYNKGNLTSADYDKLDQMAIDWDVKLMTALWPYIEKYGIENLGSGKVVEYLDNLLIVTSDYEVDKKGRRISAPRLNKQRGFAKSFLETIAKKIGGK